MEKPNSTMARQIAQAASAFELQSTGRLPKSATFILNDRKPATPRYSSISADSATDPEGGLWCEPVDCQALGMHRMIEVFNEDTSWLVSGK